MKIPALQINRMLKEPETDIREKFSSLAEGSGDIIFKISMSGKAVVFEKSKVA